MEEMLEEAEFERFRRATKLLLSLPGNSLDACIKAFLGTLSLEKDADFQSKVVALELLRVLDINTFVDAVEFCSQEMSAHVGAKDDLILNLDSKLISQIYSNEDFQKFDWEKLLVPKIFRRLLIPKAYIIQAEFVIDAICLVLDFFDSAKRGFLTGDLTPSLVKQFHKHLEEGEMRQTVIIEKIMENFGTVGLGLPANGIPYPHVENQRNLFERQIIIENISFNLR